MSQFTFGWRLSCSLSGARKTSLWWAGREAGRRHHALQQLGQSAKSGEKRGYLGHDVPGAFCLQASGQPKSKVPLPSYPTIICSAQKIIVVNSQGNLPFLAALDAGSVHTTEYWRTAHGVPSHHTIIVALAV